MVAAYGSPKAGSRASKEAFIAATKVSLMSLCTYARELAMHAWPELVTMPWVHHRTAFSMLASGNTMLGLLPPSSRVTRFSAGGGHLGDLFARPHTAGERDLADSHVRHQQGPGGSGGR